jgi:endoglucanase
MAKRMHDVARQAAPRLALIVQGSCWGGAEGLAAIDPATFNDGNIYWSFHTYEPFLLTHQGASWTGGPAAYIDGLKYPPDPKQKRAIIKAALARIAKSGLSPERRKALAAELQRDASQYFKPGWVKSAMRKPFDIVIAWADTHGVQANHILLGEFGVIKRDQSTEVPEAIRARVMQATREMAERRGMAWSVWSWGGSFGITVEEKERRFSPALLGALGLKGGP